MALKKTIFALSLMIGFVMFERGGLLAAQTSDLKPEKNTLEVAIAAYSPLYLPLFVAQEAGYFVKRGLSVNLSLLSATASAQAVISGKVDVYQGGASTIHANVGGSDLIYIGASVDRSTLVLFGQNGLTTLESLRGKSVATTSVGAFGASVDRSTLVLFGQKGFTTLESLRGKSVATTSVGAFGEIAIRKTAAEQGMEVGKDIKLVYHKGPPDAFTTFTVGNADGLIITPPHSDIARDKGYPVIVDYYEQGFRIVGPGTGVARSFMQKHPNTLKIFLMGYLDGLKRTIDDPAFAATIQTKYTKISDPKVIDQGYQQGLKVWNKDMTVDADAIRVVLEYSQNAKARGLDPQRFFDNSLIREVNRDYGSKLFPGAIK